jgi:hypothetical protein
MMNETQNPPRGRRAATPLLNHTPAAIIFFNPTGDHFQIFSHVRLEGTMNLSDIVASPQVISALLTFTLTSITAYLLYQLRIRRGNRVVLANVGKTSLVSTSKDVRANLKILYKENVVEHLYLYKFELFNSGNIDLQNVAVQIQIKNLRPGGFIEVEREDLLDKTEISLSKNHSAEKNGHETVTVSREFLNSIKKFKEEKIYLRIFSDSDLEFSVHGGGTGWSSSYEIENNNVPGNLPVFLLLFFGSVALFALVIVFKITSIVFGLLTLAITVSLVVYEIIQSNRRKLR